jgi:ribosomal protein L11 methyltransferase
VDALVVTVALADVELASDALWRLGVMAVEERVGSDPRTVELWTSLGDDTPALETAMEAIVWPWRFEAVDETAGDTWRRFAEPTWIADDLVVRPAWMPAGDLAFADAITIPIEPRSTFGMGDHPTTRLSMRALRSAVATGDRVLDVGCGSGVLAIAACLFGASSASAIDISPAAVPTTLHNAQLNGVSHLIDVSTTPLADVGGNFDVVVANILAPALIALATDLRRVMTQGGTLIISGILADRHDHVLEALVPLRPVAREDRDGWAAITLKR